MSRVIINNIRLSLESEEENAIALAIKESGISKEKIRSTTIYRKSVDARRKPPTFVYSVAIELLDGETANNNELLIKEDYENSFVTGEERLCSSPVIVGFGPAGMFAGLLLAKYGYKPVIIERGGCIEERKKAVQNFWSNGILDENSNVQFGEGGAGTFSDGKLTTRINDKRCDYILEELIKYGAPDEINKLSKPHIGTDKLCAVVKSIRNEITRLGGKVIFGTKLTDVNLENGKMKSIIVNEKDEIEASVLILAIGHSARDTFRMLLNKNLVFSTKPFSVGVRIEHLQSEIDFALYGEYAGHPKLKAADYQLSYREGDRGVYTFCMCPGGVVVAAASEKETIVTNGMSEFSRNNSNANSALAVSVLPSDFENNPLKAMEFQRYIENKAFIAGGGNYAAPVQLARDFIQNKCSKSFGAVKPSYTGNTTFANINDILPEQINKMLVKGLQVFDKKLLGFSSNNALLTGVETRTSSPIRINRNDLFLAEDINGIYPCGEGAGYAGGIMSSAVDGLRIAEAIIKKYRPFE